MRCGWWFLVPRGTYKNCHEWPLEKKYEALALAEVFGVKEASLRTGVPQRTIFRWREEGFVPPPEVVQQFLDERRRVYLEKIDQTLQKVLDEVDRVLSGEMGKDQRAAKWLHAVVGVFSQYFHKRFLLQGLPTSRVEMEKRVKRQYEITQRVISDPGARELAWRAYVESRRLDALAPGGVCVRGESGSVGAGEASLVPGGEADGCGGWEDEEADS